MSPALDNPFVVFLVSLVVQWLSAYLGYFLRLRRGQHLNRDAHDDLDTIQTAALTLLALIIGFTFSMAVTRYDQRKNYEEAEANAIGTEFLRADLLPVEDAANVRELLKRYLGQRVLFYEDRDGRQDGEASDAQRSATARHVRPPHPEAASAARHATARTGRLPAARWLTELKRIWLTRG